MANPFSSLMKIDGYDQGSPVFADRPLGLGSCKDWTLAGIKSLPRLRRCRHGLPISGRWSEDHPGRSPAGLAPCSKDRRLVLLQDQLGAHVRKLTKDQQTDINWGKRQGASEYLVKPVAPADLLVKIKALLDG